MQIRWWRSTLRRNRWLATLVLILALAGLQWLQQSTGGSGNVPAEGVSGQPRLVDGDSFHLGREEVRLVGIDAPEGRQSCTRGGVNWPCGEESRRTLARLIGGRLVSCRAVERDQHGRLLGVCTVEGRELNREMVASGLALAYGNYEREEAAARAAKRGLWSGEFERPRDWRRQHGRGRD
ncbi:MAG: thermonuclease family protein [Hyphomicrobiaceae bacterium]|nr:thermonuclease family protein [Hyphomicrobiaceae bacterium]